MDQKINQESNLNEDAEETISPTITLPWIPGVSTKLKKVFRKAGYKVAFKANSNLQTILTQKNKVKLPPNSKPGVYGIECGCTKPPYIGQTKKQIASRFEEHKEYVEKEQWEKSGAAEHARICPNGTEFSKMYTIKPMTSKFDRCVREALEIQKHGSGPNQGGINQDNGQFLKTNFWVPLMTTITKEEKEKNQRQQRQMTSNRQTLIEATAETTSVN